MTIQAGAPTQAATTVTIEQAATQHTQVFTLAGTDTLDGLRAGIAGLIEQISAMGGSPTGASCTYGADAAGNVTLTVVWHTQP